MAIIFLVLWFTFPVVLVALGIRRLYKENGLILFMIGSVAALLNLLFYIFPQVGENESLSMIITILIIVFCYQFYKFLYNQKSRKYIKYAEYFLTSIEDSDLPSCKQFLISKLQNSVNKSNRSRLPEDISRSIKLYIFELSFFCLGSSDFRDCVGDLTMEGLQMLHISKSCNSILLSDGIINEQVYNDNIEAIQEQSRCLYSLI